MRALASFAFSESGRTYARICQWRGIDPGSALDDDYLAYQLSAALMVSLDQEEPAFPQTSGHVVTDLEERMRLG